MRNNGSSQTPETDMRKNEQMTIAEAIFKGEKKRQGGGLEGRGGVTGNRYFLGGGNLRIPFWQVVEVEREEEEAVEMEKKGRDTLMLSSFPLL